MPDIDPLNVNGLVPELVGKVCESILAQEFWSEGEREEEANVVYLKADSRWTKIYFDWGIVFWRDADTGDVPTVSEKSIPTSDDPFIIRDIGTELELNGKRFKKPQMVSIKNGAMVTLEFDDGSSISFRSVNDSTNITAQQGVVAEG